MNLTLIFNRKYIWPEHYFSVWSWGNSQKLLTTNQFLVRTIFFTIMNIYFFSLRFDLFRIIAKEVNQIRNNVASVVVCLVFLFYCALTTGRCDAFQHFQKFCKKAVVKNFTIFTGKHLWWRPILKKICERLLLKCSWNFEKLKIVDKAFGT